MANLTIRNIPDELLRKIKSIAVVERRSLNNEIIKSLENSYEHCDSGASQIEKLEELRKNWNVDDSFYNSVKQAISERSMGREVNLD